MSTSADKPEPFDAVACAPPTAPQPARKHKRGERWPLSEKLRILRRLAECERWGDMKRVVLREEGISSNVTAEHWVASLVAQGIDVPRPAVSVAERMPSALGEATWKKGGRTRKAPYMSGAELIARVTRTERQRVTEIFALLSSVAYRRMRERRILELLHLPWLPPEVDMVAHTRARDKIDRMLTGLHSVAKARAQEALRTRKTLNRLIAEGRLAAYFDRRGALTVRLLTEDERRLRAMQKRLEPLERIMPLLDAPSPAIALEAAERLVAERRGLLAEAELLRGKVVEIEKLHTDIIELKVAQAASETVRRLTDDAAAQNQRWHELHDAAARRSVDLLHVLSTMLAEGAELPRHADACASCQRVKAALEQRGLLSHDHTGQ